VLVKIGDGGGGGGAKDFSGCEVHNVPAISSEIFPPRLSCASSLMLCVGGDSRRRWCDGSPKRFDAVNTYKLQERQTTP